MARAPVLQYLVVVKCRFVVPNGIADFSHARFWVLGCNPYDHCLFLRHRAIFGIAVLLPEGISLRQERAVKSSTTSLGTMRTIVHGGVARPLDGGGSACDPEGGARSDEVANRRRSGGGHSAAFRAARRRRARAFVQIGQGHFPF